MKPWSQVPVNVRNGTWTVLRDVAVDPQESIVGVTTWNGQLVVATEKQVLIFIESDSTNS